MLRFELAGDLSTSSMASGQSTHLSQSVSFATDTSAAAADVLGCSGFDILYNLDIVFATTTKHSVYHQYLQAKPENYFHCLSI
jgi:hypothetical protein